MNQKRITLNQIRGSLKQYGSKTWGLWVEKLEIWMDLGKDKLGFYKNSRKFGLKVIKIDLERLRNNKLGFCQNSREIWNKNKVIKIDLERLGT